MNNIKTSVAEATQELSNVTNEVTSINNSNSGVMERNDVVAQTTRIANINGEEVNIVVAHTKYSMELPKDKKNLCGSIDHNKMLNCIYHLASPEIFWEAGIELFDEENSPVEKDTENVFVLCPTADTYWRIAIDGKLNNVEVHTFKSVEEYAQTIGCTNLYSRGLSNIEKMGVAALATGDEASKAVFEFAKKYAMPITTAQLYFDYKVKPTTILSMTMGEMPEVVPVLGRTVEEAEELFAQTQLAFKKNALKRYAIRSINTILHQEEYSFDEMIIVLKSISDDEVKKIKSTPCEEKERCITIMLTKHIERIKTESVQVEKAA